MYPALPLLVHTSVASDSIRTGMHRVFSFWLWQAGLATKKQLTQTHQLPQLVLLIFRISSNILPNDDMLGMAD